MQLNNQKGKAQEKAMETDIETESHYHTQESHRNWKS